MLKIPIKKSVRPPPPKKKEHDNFFVKVFNFYNAFTFGRDPP